MSGFTILMWGRITLCLRLKYGGLIVRFRERLWDRDEERGDGLHTNTWNE